MNREFSVLMSVYIKETKENFKECMDSLLAQTVMPMEIVVVKDGPISQVLETSLREYQHDYPNMIRVVGYEENRGLGYALAYGIKACRYELIARMDTDDIARNDRFEKQLAEFEADEELMICGSHIVEFIKDKAVVKDRRCVPLEDQEIRRRGKLRDPFNHVTVMFRKSMVLQAGNYESCLSMEDSVLWAKMLQLPNGHVKNIDDYLVYVRADEDMIERRGGLWYLKRYMVGRKRMWELGYIGAAQYYFSIFAQFLVAIMPLKLRNIVFMKLLRK
ncbi:glycosyltransferase [uncultured Selenomonas sp.]|uniref:glycosyltransferase n=1 Tax=uncultured Selenomonas sp. TaxID=159275 RepID=UPI0028E5C28A|nr:glycosyltransferase [uncultured Selenomonas sp.]